MMVLFSAGLKVVFTGSKSVSLTCVMSTGGGALHDNRKDVNYFTADPQLSVPYG